MATLQSKWLDVESEVNYVAFLHDVVFAFKT